MRAVLTGGAGLVVLYTGLISMADAITKQLAAIYQAPQMYVIAGVVVVFLCLMSSGLSSWRGGGTHNLSTNCPRAMAIRAGATILATLCFFFAFKRLPFAQVFLFIGLMPLFAALLAGPVLKDCVSPGAWTALVAGFLGVLCLFPQGISEIGFGHLIALAAAFFGTVSIVVSRYIGRFDTQSLPQVYYPNLALLIVMAIALPFVWQPMAFTDLVWASVYGAVLFLARLVLVVALRDIAAHAATSLMKLQFVWMVFIGAFVFGEWPPVSTFLGAAIVIASGLFLVYEDQFKRQDISAKA